MPRCSCQRQPGGVLSGQFSKWADRPVRVSSRYRAGCPAWDPVRAGGQKNTQVHRIRVPTGTHLGMLELMTSLPVWVKRRHIGLCKIWKSAGAETLFYVHLNNVDVVLNLRDFKNIFYNSWMLLNVKRSAVEFSIHVSTLHSCTQLPVGLYSTFALCIAFI